MLLAQLRKGEMLKIHQKEHIVSSLYSHTVKSCGSKVMALGSIAGC